MKPVKVTGVKQTVALLGKAERDIKTNVSREFAQIALLAEAEVKKSVAGRGPEKMSVDTGFFLRSITATHGADYAKVESQVPYSKYLEYGTSRMQPRSHFRNSISRIRAKSKGLLMKALKKASK